MATDQADTQKECTGTAIVRNVVEKGHKGKDEDRDRLRAE